MLDQVVALYPIGLTEMHIQICQKAENHITMCNLTKQCFIGVELVSPAPIVNGLIRLYVIVPFALP